MWRLLLLALASAAASDSERDGETSRKVLGSSVVTSVSVIMDAGNGSKIYADAVGRPVSKPQVADDLASPIDLLNPDRYEFYTFDDAGELVKRLMTLEEIRDIIATGDDDGFTLDDLGSNGFLPEKRVNDVVNNVQNVLKEEIKTHKYPDRPQFDTPDVSDSWSMILPAIFGNSGEDIKPEAPVVHVTPDTIMVEPTISAEQISTTEKVMTLAEKVKTTTTSTTEKVPMINVEIITNSNSTTERTEYGGPVIEIKPLSDLEMTKEVVKPVSQVVKGTKKPFPVKVTTFRPVKRPLSTRTTSTASRRTSTTPRTTTTAPPTSTVSQATSTTTKVTSTTSRETSTTETTSTTTETQSTTPRTTSRPVPVLDTIGQPSSVLFEKIAPPRTSTTTTTESSTVPTSITESSTFIERLVPFTTTAIPTDPTTTDFPSESTILFEEFKSTPSTILEKVPETTSTFPEITSTYGPLSTFFLVSGNKLNPIKTEDDLSTLSTDYVINKLPSTSVGTTESQATDRISTFDQFLLTSTNIYEINSELSDLQSTTNIDESTESNSTERIFIRLTNPTEAPITTTAKTTTDQTFIETIEQLISQAVGTEVPTVETEKEAAIVEGMMMSSGNKTMPEILAQTATVASNLVGIREESTTVGSTAGVDDLLSDSVEALLSQVYGDGSTLIYESTSFSEGTTTEVPTIRTTTQAPTTATTTRAPTTTSYITKAPTTTSTTTQAQTTTSTTTRAPTTTSTTTRAPTTTTTTQVPTTTASTQTPATSTTTRAPTTPIPSTTPFVPHIINITIIRNENRTQAKPAKSDLSLEKEYENLYNEMKKNSTLESSEELLNTDSTSSIQGSEPTATTTEEVIVTTPEPKPSFVIVINETKEEGNWMLVSTVAPHEVKNDPIVEEEDQEDPPPPVDLVPKPLQGFGLEESTAKLDSDIYQFVQLCNELAFGFWKSVTTGLNSARGVIVSPFAATSLLAMVFLGARGATSGEMNEILKLDDMVTFNPHLIFKNVSESIEANAEAGVAVSAIVRELYSDRSKGKLLGFYKERVRQFYDGHVEEASFRDIGDIIRRRTNLLVKKNTDGRILEFLKDGSLVPKAPLAGISASIFQTDCSQASFEGRDGELHFVVFPSLRQRRLIPIPAIVYRSGFLAGYEPSLDATVAALGTKDQAVSTIFIIPGQQGVIAPGDGLSRLEKRLVESSFKKGAWSRLLRSLIPRPGLELQLPRFQHRSLINATESLKKMGLHELFDVHKANLKGLNGAAHELHLSDVVQINEFATCGEGRIGEGHHRETYPTTVERRGRALVMEWEEPRDYQRAFDDPLHDPSYLALPLALRPRQARLPETPRLRFDRPFLYFVRHNPSGLILHMGRFHPRLLP